MDFNESVLIEICRKFNIRMLVLFGSRASGKYHANSDYDFGVLLDSDNIDYDKLLSDFTQALEGQQIDLAILNHSDPVFRFEIISNYRLIFCSDEEVFYNFYTNTIKQYNDIQKFISLEEQYLKSFIRGDRDGIYKCSPPKVN